MAVLKHRARKKQIIEDLISSGDLELTAKASKMKEDEKAYNRKQGIKKRKTVTMAKKKTSKKYLRKTLELRQPIKPSSAMGSVF